VFNELTEFLPHKSPLDTLYFSERGRGLSNGFKYHVNTHSSLFGLKSDNMWIPISEVVTGTDNQGAYLIWPTLLTLPSAPFEPIFDGLPTPLPYPEGSITPLSEG